MSEIIIAIVGLLGTIIVAILGLYGARRYNIGPNQDKLVSTLKDIVAAQGERIDQLEQESKERDGRIILLTTEVTRLTNLALSQLMKINELELQLERERRND